MAREYEPVAGQWYENVDESETFRVLSVDEDSELIEIEYLDGDIEEIDLDTWHELDLEPVEQPEGWSEEKSARAGGARAGQEEEEQEDDLGETWSEDEDEDEEEAEEEEEDEDEEDEEDEDDDEDEDEDDWDEDDEEEDRY